MARIPNRVQGQPFNVSQASRSGLPASVQAQNLPLPAAILVPGPAQPLEYFGSLQNVPAPLARAMNDLQTNVAQALNASKSDPTANKTLIEQLAITQGGSSGATPYNYVAHGLGAPYRGYRIDSVRNGYVTGHAAIAPTAETPASQALLLWTAFTAFGSAPVTIDLEVWA